MVEQIADTESTRLTNRAGDVFDYAVQAMMAAYRLNSLQVDDLVDEIEARNDEIERLRDIKKALREMRDFLDNGGVEKLDPTDNYTPAASYDALPPELEPNTYYYYYEDGVAKRVMVIDNPVDPDKPVYLFQTWNEAENTWDVPLASTDPSGKDAVPLSTTTVNTPPQGTAANDDDSDSNPVQTGRFGKGSGNQNGFVKQGAQGAVQGVQQPLTNSDQDTSGPRQAYLRFDDNGNIITSPGQGDRSGQTFLRIDQNNNIIFPGVDPTETNVPPGPPPTNNKPSFHIDGNPSQGGVEVTVTTPGGESSKFFNVSAEVLGNYGIGTDGKPINLYNNDGTLNTKLFDDTLDTIEDDISGLASQNQLLIIRLQQGVNNLNLLVSLMSNMIKSENDANEGVARNL